MKRKKAFFASLLAIVMMLSACGSYQFKPTTSYELGDFHVTNHRGEEVSLKTLEGKPWFAMFIFTNCVTVCPPMTFNMKGLQDEIEKLDITDYNIVAFSVDPTTDTQEVLTKYLAPYEVADESKWHLLTGYKQEWIEQYAYNNFKSIVKMPTSGDQVLHANTFYLVDENGVAVKNYTGASEQADGVSLDTMAFDLEALIKQSKK